MKLGEERIIKDVCVEQECAECGESAKWKHTFLFNNARRNPISKAYGKDDCSWCEDDCKYACDEHKEKVRQDEPSNMSWCSTFSRENFEHLFLYWKNITNIS